MQGDHTLVRDNNATFDDGKNSRPTRRTVVRVGATAAWAVPVIAMAAPAQAVTASGGTTTLTAVVVPHSQGQSEQTVTFQVQVCNTGTSATAGLSATAGGGSHKLTGFTVGSWPGATNSKGATSLSVSAPTDGQIAKNSCSTYLVSFTLHDAGTQVIKITFKTTNGALATFNITTS